MRLTARGKIEGIAAACPGTGRLRSRSPERRCGRAPEPTARLALLNTGGKTPGLERQPDGSQPEGSPEGPGARRDVIGVGGSAGALDAMLALVAGLPPDFDGSVFVVSHI